MVVAIILQPRRRFDILIVLYARMNMEGDKRLTTANIDKLGVLDHSGVDMIF